MCVVACFGLFLFVGFGQSLNDVAMGFGAKGKVIANTAGTLVIAAILIMCAWHLSGRIEAVSAAVLISMVVFSMRALWLGVRVIGISYSESRAMLIAILARSAMFLFVCQLVIELQVRSINYINNSVFLFAGLNFLALIISVIFLVFFCKNMRVRSSLGFY